MSPYLLVLLSLTFLFDQSLSQPAALGITQQQPISPIQPSAPAAAGATGQPIQQQQPATITPVVPQPIQQQQPATITPALPQPAGGTAGIAVSPQATEPLPTTDLPPLPPLTIQPAAAPSPMSQEVGFCKIQIKQRDGKLVWQSIDGTIVDHKCDDQETSDRLAPVGLVGGAVAPGLATLGPAPEPFDSSSGHVFKVGPEQQSLNDRDSGAASSGNQLPVTASNKQQGVGGGIAVDQSGAEEKMAAMGFVLTSAVFVSLMSGFGFLI